MIVKLHRVDTQRKMKFQMEITMMQGDNGFFCLESRSKPHESNTNAGNMNKTFVSDQAAIPSHRHTPKVFLSRIRSLHFPTPTITSPFSGIFIKTIQPIGTIRYNNIYTASCKLGSQSIIIITLIRNHPFRLQYSTSLFPTSTMCSIFFYLDTIDYLLCNMAFVSRGTLHFDIQCYAIAIDKQHNHRTLTAPCFSSINVSSRNVSSSRNLPCSSNNANRCRWVSTNTPSSHSRSPRRHVLQLGKFLGMCSQGRSARANKMRASNTRWLSTRGRPPCGPIIWLV